MQIEFAPTEYVTVTEFAGSIGDTKGTFVVTYLRIQTNLETYQIHGTGLNAQANTSAVETSIVGFFGCQGDNLIWVKIWFYDQTCKKKQCTRQDLGHLPAGRNRSESR